MPDHVFLAQMLALLLVGGAVHNPKLFGSLQGADLFDFFFTFDQPSAS